MGGAISAAPGLVRISLQFPLAFPYTLVFLCPVEKDIDIDVVLETLETTVSLVKEKWKNPLPAKH